MDEFKAFTLRLPVELYDRVAVAALNDDRSLNNWVMRIIRVTLEAK